MSEQISIAALLSVYSKDKLDLLDACFESLFKQEALADEIVVVQEGEVSEAIENALCKWQARFGAQKFRWFRIPWQNGPLGYGLPASLNYGIEKARSAYIARVDTDDIY